MARLATDVTTVLPADPGGLLTVRHLRVAGDNRTIGQVLAEAALGAHGTAAGPHPAPDPTVQRARRHWFQAHHAALTDRMAGMGDVFAIDPDDDGWDLGRLGPVDVPAGCSAVFHPASRTARGHALLGRNFDFPTGTYSEIVAGVTRPQERPLAGDPWVIEMYPDDGYATIVIGIMDMLGGMDGLNEHGLAVTLLADNESPAAEPSVVPQVGLSEQQVVRYLLESCRDVDEAKQALLMAKQYYLFTPCHFLVADRAGASFVWEYSPGHNREHIVEPPATGSLVCTNHLLHRWPDPAQLPDDPRSAGTAACTYQRWRALDEHVRRTALVSPAQLRDQLDTVTFTWPAPGVRTLWQAVYDLHDRSIEVSFFTGDDRHRSGYSPPIRFSLDEQQHDDVQRADGGTAVAPTPRGRAAARGRSTRTPA